VGALFVVTLSRTPPAWWRPLDTRHPGTLDAAGAIEAGIINAMHKRRDADPAFEPAPGQYRSAAWRHDLDAASASAWLSAKLPRWIDSRVEGVRWPAEMAQIQVEFREGRIEAGTLIPMIDEEGSLWLRAESVRIGRLPLPRAWAGTLAMTQSPQSLDDVPDGAALMAKLTGEEPLIESAGVRLSDGRRVRLIDVRPREGRLELTCATEKGL
jgi:hypothetical protein